MALIGPLSYQKTEVRFQFKRFVPLVERHELRR
jgi:hypothetical protein